MNNKFSRLLLLFGISLLMIGCSTDNDIQGSGNGDKDLPANTTFMCGGATVADPEATRTSLNGTTINWVAGDKIIINGYTSSYGGLCLDENKEFSTSETGSTVSFRGHLGGASNHFIGTYGCNLVDPDVTADNLQIKFNIPAEQTLDITSGSNTEGFCTKNPSWTCWTGDEMTFHNICAYLHFSINESSKSTTYNEVDFNSVDAPIEVASDVTKIVIEETQEIPQPISGTFTCKPNLSDGKSVSDFAVYSDNGSYDNGSKIVVNIPAGHFGDAYVPILPTAQKLRVTLVGKNVTEYNYTLSAPLQSGIAKNFIFGSGVYYMIKDVDELGMKFSDVANANERGLDDNANVRWVKWSSATLPNYLKNNTLKTADYYVSTANAYHVKIKTVGSSTMSESQLNSIRDVLYDGFSETKGPFIYYDFYRAKYVSDTTPSKTFSINFQIRDIRLFGNITTVAADFCRKARRIKCADLLNTTTLAGSYNFGDGNQSYRSDLRAVRMWKVQGTIPRGAFTFHRLPYIQLQEGITRIEYQAFQSDGVASPEYDTKSCNWVDLPSSLSDFNNETSIFGSVNPNANFCKTIYIRREDDFTKVNASVFKGSSPYAYLGNAINNGDIQKAYMTQATYDQCLKWPGFKNIFGANTYTHFTPTIVENQAAIEALMPRPYRSDYWMRTDDWK